MNAAQTPERERLLLTIGTVCTRLQSEFPDISISKIRYLEDQGLLAPRRRLQSGYRLFSEDDVERLMDVLRLQRDEFLPLRVIWGRSSRRRRERARSGVAVGRGPGRQDDELDLSELCERAAITHELARKLEEYGLLHSRRSGSDKLYPAGDVDVAVACEKLSRFGIGPGTCALPDGGRPGSSLLQQLVAPSLRSRNPERREAAVQQLQTLAELAQELSQLLFWRDLRHLAGN